MPTSALLRDRLQSWMSPGQRPPCSCRLLAESEWPSKCVESAAVDPVAEAFIRISFGSKRLEQGTKKRWDFRHRHVGGVQAIEARAVEIAPEHDVVFAKRRADEADVAQVRTRAPVGAAAHPDADALFGKTQLVLHRADVGEQPGHRPRRLPDRQAAGGMRRPGPRGLDG